MHITSKPSARPGFEVIAGFALYNQKAIRTCRCKASAGRGLRPVNTKQERHPTKQAWGCLSYSVFVWLIAIA